MLQAVGKCDKRANRFNRSQGFGSNSLFELSFSTNQHMNFVLAFFGLFQSLSVFCTRRRRFSWYSTAFFVCNDRLVLKGTSPLGKY